jgi:ABC-2 type transport system ATP-binding protein
VGFLGPNGAGKTTTIRVLTCFHPATSGTATVAGHDVVNASVAVRSKIGYLPENVPVYNDLRVQEYLRYRAALKGVPRRKRKQAVGSVIERCGLHEVRRKLVGHVSRGYRQRVGLADALVADPPILILDEPTSGLDPNQRRRVKQLVRDLSEKHTILFSSHILAEVQDVCSRILVIHRGKIRADGAPDSLVEEAHGKQLVLSARLPAPELAAKLAGVKGLGGLTTRLTSDGFTTMSGSVERGADPRDEVYRRLVDVGVPLRELRLDLPSLEEYFQQVTEGFDLEEERASSSGPGSETVQRAEETAT